MANFNDYLRTIKSVNLMRREELKVTGQNQGIINGVYSERYNPYKSLMTSTNTAAHTAKDINSDVPMAVETDIVDDKLDGHKEFPFEDAMEAETNVLQED